MSDLPATIGRYHIVKRLGRGGMGVVYLARDPVIDRDVAIKVLRTLDEADLRARFAREIQIAGGLAHPNIVRIYDAGEFDDMPFVAMEYVGGPTLDHVIKGGTPVSLDRKLELLIDLADGLAHAHNRKVVHRDIKPSNLIIDEHDRLKILDFGIARFAASGNVSLFAVGTPSYMAPEQIRGEQVDARCDIFSAGVVAYELATGEIHIFRAKSVVFATGGFGKVWKTTSNAHTLTGDGMGVCYRRGLPLEDMEFYQFHPTGLAGLGVLLTEGARGEGGILRNATGERFMERYAPTIKDLAPRDMVSRSMVLEVREGRGAGPNKDYVYLDLTHLPKEQIEEKLPDITEFARTYLGVDPVTELVPVFPTAHYAMGGIPTDVEARVLRDADHVIPGLYAAGECACVSVHGANRLGTNSLLDINVFGRRAGIAAAEYAVNAEFVDLPDDSQGYTIALVEQLRSSTGTERVSVLRREMQETMDLNAQVYRTEATLKQALDDVQELKRRYKNVAIQDKGVRYNTDLMEAIELGFLLDLAELVVTGALARQESRGGHAREDYPNRDDANFMRHSLAYRRTADDGSTYVELDYKPVVVTRYQPMERKY